MTTPQEIVSYFTEKEIEESPMYVRTNESEFEESEVYESALAFVEKWTPSYRGLIKLDDKLLMCKFAMYLHLDCTQFVDVVRERLENGHLDFTYADLERTFEGKIDEMYLKIACFLHMLQFSPARALDFCPKFSEMNEIVHSNFSLFKLYYNAMKLKNRNIEINYFVSRMEKSLKNLPIEFVPYFLEIFEKHPLEMFCVLHNTIINSNLSLYYFSKILQHYIGMSDENLTLCFTNILNLSNVSGVARIVVSIMRTNCPGLYRDFISKLKSTGLESSTLNILFPDFQSISVKQTFTPIRPDSPTYPWARAIHKIYGVEANPIKHMTDDDHRARLYINCLGSPGERELLQRFDDADKQNAARFLAEFERQPHFSCTLLDIFRLKRHLGFSLTELEFQYEASIFGVVW